jgi:chromosome segregation ATPase
MTTEISSKNTKSQILQAYEDLIKNVKNAKANIPKQVQEEKQHKEIVERVTDVSNKIIGKEIGNLRSNLNNSLEELENNLLEEFKKLEDIRAAIAVEKQNLEDLYSLSATTDSLAAMILAQKEQKENFEAEMVANKEVFEIEMKELREKWNEEKEKQAAEQKENSEQLKKNHKREEEEYLYKLKVDRQKENDEYEVKKVKLEKDLSEKQLSFDQEMAKREADVSNAEAELNELRKNSEEFPGKLEKVLVQKEKDVTAHLTAQFEFESKLLEKHNEGELKLKEQTIKSLQEKIAEMQGRIKELTEKTKIAESSVKDIAVKAIESSSKVQVFQNKEKIEN